MNTDEPLEKLERKNVPACGKTMPEKACCRVPLGKTAATHQRTNSRVQLGTFPESPDNFHPAELFRRTSPFGKHDRAHSFSLSIRVHPCLSVVNQSASFRLKTLLKTISARVLPRHIPTAKFQSRTWEHQT
jgi:hypothetical protein